MYSSLCTRGLYQLLINTCNCYILNLSIKKRKKERLFKHYKEPRVGQLYVITHLRCQFETLH